MLPAIPDYFKKFFENYEQEYLAQSLIAYVIFDVKPEITPALWQDAEIFIRYKQRDVWSITDQQAKNAEFAIMLYRIKYIIGHLKKPEIMKLLNKLFGEENEGENFQTLPQLLEKEFHAPIDSLIMTQEKRVVTKHDLKIFDSLFEYPAWLAFDDDANRAIYDKIIKDELTDTQIDYFLGADDEMKNYDELLPVVKHILMTTHNFHTFWIAADVLNIIWHAVPEEEKAQAWFRDEVFSIFWPRVGTNWPLFNNDMVNFDLNDDTKILGESIGWLRSLTDLPNRVPGFDRFKSGFKSSADDLKEITEISGAIKAEIKKGQDLKGVLNAYYDICERVEKPDQLAVLEETEEALVKYLETFPDSADRKKIISEVKNAFKHAKKYTAHVKHESDKLVKAFVEA